LGNFPWIFDDAFQQAYLPMLEALERHPKINMSLHYSGCLFDWLKQKHPEFIVLLKMLLNRGQIEILGGGYYEPILPAIPDADKAGQIEKMSAFLTKEFGRNPEGIWLAERVWEPSLVKILAEAAVKWTLIDDTGFKMVGMNDSDLFGYFNTEEQGSCMKIFPISKYLRYAIPWHRVTSVIEYLANEASESLDRIVVLGDDGEKFGIWPETCEHCWEKGWVEDFFKAIEDNLDWLHVTKLGEYARSHSPLGRIYLPCASYDEMMEWSLPVEKSWAYSELKDRLDDEQDSDIKQFLYCGFWRNFLVKYPEINRMYKKMLYVHSKVYRARSRHKSDCGLDELWKAQCNCPYWHGVFGGIYLTDIRAITYTHLIQAENKADKILHNPGRGFNWHQADFDGDGRQEILIEGRNYNLYLSTDEGGSIFEWDLRNPAYNLLCSLSRKPEAYHKAILQKDNQSESSAGDKEIASIHDKIRVKDGDFTEYLVYDNLPKNSLIDRFFSRETTLENLEANDYAELGQFTGKVYDAQVENRGPELNVLMKRRAAVNSDTGKGALLLEKSIVLSNQNEKLQFDYQFTNTGSTLIDVIFGSEWNINLLGGGHNSNAYFRLPGSAIDEVRLDSQGQFDNCTRLIMGNRQLGIEIELNVDRPLTLWRFPVETVSNSEGGVEKIYQCSCVVILLPLHIEPGQKLKFKYSWNNNK